MSNSTTRASGASIKDIVGDMFALVMKPYMLFATDPNGGQGNQGTGDGGEGGQGNQGTGDGGEGGQGNQGTGDGNQGNGTGDGNQGTIAGGAGDGKQGDGGQGNGNAGGQGGSPGSAGGAKGKQEDPAEGYWPADWREKYANGDEKLLKRLQRFDSPQAAMDSYFSLEKKLNSGEFKSKLPANATEDQIKAWRADNGIPEEPSGYEIKLADGLNISEDDQPIVDTFLERAHAANMTPDQVNGALNFYFEMQEEAIAAQSEIDQQSRRTNDDELRQEWGAEYRGNINAVKSLLDSAPAGLGERLMGARLADGSLLGNDPTALRWLLGMAKEIDPTHTVVPGAGSKAFNAIEDEITAIEKRMAEDRAGYFKDEKAQNRYRELLEARDKIKARG